MADTKASWWPAGHYVRSRLRGRNCRSSSDRLHGSPFGARTRTGGSSAPARCRCPAVTGRGGLGACSGLYRDGPRHLDRQHDFCALPEGVITMDAVDATDDSLSKRAGQRRDSVVYGPRARSPSSSAARQPSKNCVRTVHCVQLHRSRSRAHRDAAQRREVPTICAVAAGIVNLAATAASDAWPMPGRTPWYQVNRPTADYGSRLR
jgi:hypothetical protein